MLIEFKVFVAALLWTEQKINSVLRWKMEGFHEIGVIYIYDFHRWLCEGMFPLSDLGVR